MKQGSFPQYPLIDCILNNVAIKVLQNEKYNPLLLSEILTNDNFLCLIVMWKSMLTIMIYVSQIRKKNITNRLAELLANCAPVQFILILVSQLFTNKYCISVPMPETI